MQSRWAERNLGSAHADYTATNGLPDDGQIIFVNPKKIALVQSSGGKYITSVFRKIMCIFCASRLGKRGERVVTIVGRDAMDVRGVARRATARADGQGVQARRPSGRCQVVR